MLASAAPIVGEHGAARVRVALGETLRVHVVPPAPPALEPRPVPRAPQAEEPPKIVAD